MSAFSSGGEEYGIDTVEKYGRCLATSAAHSIKRSNLKIFTYRTSQCGAVYSEFILPSRSKGDLLGLHRKTAGPMSDKQSSGRSRKLLFSFIEDTTTRDGDTATEPQRGQLLGRLTRLRLQRAPASPQWIELFSKTVAFQSSLLL